MSDLVVTRWGARFLGRQIPCAIGRGGIVLNKREGDGATPLGVFPVANWRIWVRPDRVKQAGPVLRLSDIWSDDSKDPLYNRFIPAAPAHPFSHERLWRADPLYDVVVDIGYNADPTVAGAGSALFLHTWRKPRHPTEGCVAFARKDLLWLLSHLGAHDRLVIQ